MARVSPMMTGVPNEEGYIKTKKHTRCPRTDSGQCANTLSLLIYWNILEEAAFSTLTRMARERAQGGRC